MVVGLGGERLGVVLGHQRQGRAGRVVVVAMEAAQAGDRVVTGEEAVLLIVGVAVEQRQSCSPAVEPGKQSRSPAVKPARERCEPQAVAVDPKPAATETELFTRRRAHAQHYWPNAKLHVNDDPTVIDKEGIFGLPCAASNFNVIPKMLLFSPESGNEVLINRIKHTNIRVMKDSQSFEK